MGGTWPKGHSLQTPALDQCYYKEIGVDVESRNLGTFRTLRQGTCVVHSPSLGGVIANCVLSSR